jgi:hypothetical protein
MGRDMLGAGAICSLAFCTFLNLTFYLYAEDSKRLVDEYES